MLIAPKYVGSIEGRLNQHKKSENRALSLIILLTNPALDPIGKIPEYKVCAVKVKAA